MCTGLSKLIENLNALFLEVFSKLLKPKFHILTHYPSIMNKIGPLQQTYTLRFEAKRRQLKLIGNAVSSRINITTL